MNQEKIHKIGLGKGEWSYNFQIGKPDNLDLTTYIFELDEPNTKLTAIFFGKAAGESPLKIKIIVIHNSANTCSDLKVKTVHKTGSEFYIDATLRVEASAQNSVANLEHNALLLGKATVTSIPRTECLNHLSTCNHAASIHNVDKDILNYLATRGFSKGNSLKLFEENFAQPA